MDHLNNDEAMSILDGQLMGREVAIFTHRQFRLAAYVAKEEGI